MPVSGTTAVRLPHPPAATVRPGALANAVLLGYQQGGGSIIQHSTSSTTPHTQSRSNSTQPVGSVTAQAQTGSGDHSACTQVSVCGLHAPNTRLQHSSCCTCTSSATVRAVVSPSPCKQQGGSNGPSPRPSILRKHRLTPNLVVPPTTTGGTSESGAAVAGLYTCANATGHYRYLYSSAQTCVHGGDRQ
jgi:hypothetical protein